MPKIKRKPSKPAPDASTLNKVETFTTDMQKLRPNPWNQNKMTEFAMGKLKAGIEAMRPAFVDPITVRSGDESGEFEDGMFEIIDGYHRWLAAQELGITLVPVVCLGHVATPVAKTLTITLNEVKGKPDTDKLAALIAELQTETPELVNLLPYDEKELDAYVAANSANLEALDKAARENAARVVAEQDDDGDEGSDVTNVVDVLRLSEIDEAEDAKLVKRLLALGERIEQKRPSSLLVALIRAAEKKYGVLDV